jgi:hypothetical protein
VEMIEPTYTIVVTESERTAMAKVLGALVTKLINAPIFVEAPSESVQLTGLDRKTTYEAPSGGTQQARSVLSPPTTPAAAPATPPTIEQRDRWARDRSGKELPDPTGFFARVVNLCKTEQKQPRKAGGKPYLKVTWQSEASGFRDANCFDQKLWPWLINQSGKRTTIYFVQAGEYLNVVGVRA